MRSLKYTRIPLLQLSATEFSSKMKKIMKAYIYIPVLLLFLVFSFGCDKYDDDPVFPASDFISQGAYQGAYWPTGEWRSCAPDEVGMDPEKLKELNEEIRLLLEINIEIHSRLAFGVCCVVLVLLGAALGILCRSGHLLTAFGISCIPASVCLITIFTGKHIAEQSGMSLQLGILFLWSGIAIVAVVNILVYKHLLKR